MTDNKKTNKVITDKKQKTQQQNWQLYEVFVRSRNGLDHIHVGSVHAPDNEIALMNARDLYTRRMEGISIWVVPSNQIYASESSNSDSMFEPSTTKVYRHPTFYEIPDEIGHM